MKTMSKTIYAAALLLCVACTTAPEKKELTAEEYQAKAMEIYGGNAETEKLREAIGYLDTAITLNPNLKAAYTAKGELLRRLNDQEGLFNHLVKTNNLMPGQSSVVLNLGLEYESRGDSLLAQKSYAEAANLINSTLDTLPNPTVQVRNSYANKLCMALLLQNAEPKSNKHVAAIMENSENRGFTEMINAVSSLPRAELVAMSRGMAAPNQTKTNP